MRAVRLGDAAPGLGYRGRCGLLAAVGDHVFRTTPYLTCRAAEPAGNRNISATGGCWDAPGIQVSGGGAGVSESSALSPPLRRTLPGYGWPDTGRLAPLWQAASRRFQTRHQPRPGQHGGARSVPWGEEVRDRYDAPDLNLARYIKDGTVTDTGHGE